MKRHEIREKALQVLFQLENTDLTLEEAISHIIEDNEMNPFFKTLVYGVTKKLQEIDHQLEEKLENWSLYRLPKIERTILRLALYELLYMDETPSAVVLDEAIELAKTFGDDKSSKFVNGVLSKFVEQ
ncbi:MULTISPECIES: transcription antitermination factor NusB [Ureibacillus]|jgi:transcription antitermination protein NusB|uniref:Transcription antitermination protein NusB n=1 Tax=Ureibacillus thermosphaericus TaxID=51173 RepID=A0A840PQK4_URETH|nr:transcription antitermination factor NusB [Ureibacillus thermosphaericus]MBB5148779.1 N utilization substance protein B [Ureibacillus thermosphaericus]NKZ31557.1 transcription antitermination factor NusB [Ureibacillus thermosphaericus]